MKWGRSVLERAGQVVATPLRFMTPGGLFNESKKLAGRLGGMGTISGAMPGCPPKDRQGQLAILEAALAAWKPWSLTTVPGTFVLHAYPGEPNMHFPGHNFTGPGSDVVYRICHGIRPTDSVDNASYRHDMRFGTVQLRRELDLIDNAEAARQVRAADLEMLGELKRLANPLNMALVGNPAGLVAGLAGIGAKVALEDVSLKDPMDYVGGKDIQKFESCGRYSQRGYRKRKKARYY